MAKSTIKIETIQHGEITKVKRINTTRAEYSSFRGNTFLLNTFDFYLYQNMNKNYSFEIYILILTISWHIVRVENCEGDGYA